MAIVVVVMWLLSLSATAFILWMLWKTFEKFVLR